MRPEGGAAKKGAERAHLEMRRAKAEALELAGASVRQIARELQIDVHTAHDDLKAVREARRREAAGVDLKEERDLELSRLEQQRVQLNQMLQDPKVDAIAVHRVLIRVAERKSKLIGLDAPTRISTDLPVGDPMVEMFEEAPKELTLGDLLGDKGDSARDLAKVLHMHLPQTG